MNPLSLSISVPLERYSVEWVLNKEYSRCSRTVALSRRTKAYLWVIAHTSRGLPLVILILTNRDNISEIGKNKMQQGHRLLFDLKNVHTCKQLEKYRSKAVVPKLFKSRPTFQNINFRIPHTFACISKYLEKSIVKTNTYSRR